MSNLLEHLAGAAARFAPSRHATILCYHGVEPFVAANTFSAHVSVKQFRETIAAARSVGEPVSLRELLRRQDEGRSTAGLFALTFDDAYTSLASPDVRDLVVRGGLPITIFVVTGASAAGMPFWWDRVETLYPIVAPDAWARFEESIGLPKAYRTPASIPFGPLRPLRQWVLHRSAGRWPTAAEDALAALESSVRLPQIQRPMSFDEIDSLVTTGLVDIGVHTVSHRVIPLLSDEEARAEIGGSYRTLRERWPFTLPWLAAPFGLYDEHTSRITRAAGLDGFLSLYADTIDLASTVHGVPRMNITETLAPWKVALRLSGAQQLLSAPRRRRRRLPNRPGPD